MKVERKLKWIPLPLLLGGLWLGMVAAGHGLLYQYSLTPGAAAESPAKWPEGLAIERATDRPTLVMIAHPHCSCTRASIAELARLMARLDERVRCYVLFERPEGTGSNWEKSDLWRSASRINGVTAVVDRNGDQAQRLGAKTSGQTYLFHADGRLLFAGGITPSRSHQGNSVGRERILSLVDRGDSDRPVSDVYGCALDEAHARSAERPKSLLEMAEFGTSDQ